MYGFTNQRISIHIYPLNTTIILDGDTDYIDDALAVVEVRMLAPSTIIDEFEFIMGIIAEIKMFFMLIVKNTFP